MSKESSSIQFPHQIFDLVRDGHLSMSTLLKNQGTKPWFEGIEKSVLDKAESLIKKGKYKAAAKQLEPHLSSLEGEVGEQARAFFSGAPEGKSPLFSFEEEVEETEETTSTPEETPVNVSTPAAVETTPQQGLSTPQVEFLKGLIRKLETPISVLTTEEEEELKSLKSMREIAAKHSNLSHWADLIADIESAIKELEAGVNATPMLTEEEQSLLELIPGK